MPIHRQEEAGMPFTRISMREGRSAADKKKIVEDVYLALREAFNVPEDDLFSVITEHGANDFYYSRNYLGIERSDELIFIQITATHMRTEPQKKALFAGIARRLNKSIGVRPEDVFINLVEVLKENWSFGLGIAQYAV